MEKNNIFLTWILIISTFLIAGKAIGILDISWLIAFGPIAAMMIVSVVIFIVSFVYMYIIIDKKIKEGEDE